MVVNYRTLSFVVHFIGTTPRAYPLKERNKLLIECIAVSGLHNNYTITLDTIQELLYTCFTGSGRGNVMAPLKKVFKLIVK